MINNVGTSRRNLDYEYDMPMLHRNRFNYLGIISLDNKGIFYTWISKLSRTKMIRVERQSSGTGDRHKSISLFIKTLSLYQLNGQTLTRLEAPRAGFVLHKEIWNDQKGLREEGSPERRVWSPPTGSRSHISSRPPGRERWKYLLKKIREN